MTPKDSILDRRRKWFHDTFVREVVFWSLAAFCLGNALLMVGLLSIAAFEGVKACLTFLGWLPPPVGFPSAEEAGIHLGLRSIELVLLAPLGYLFVESLAIFVKALVEEEGERWLAALRMVTGVKSLAISLLISVMAADFVGKVLRGEKFDVPSGLIEGLILALLLGYLFVLGKELGHERRGNR